MKPNMEILLEVDRLSRQFADNYEKTNENYEQIAYAFLGAFAAYFLKMHHIPVDDAVTFVRTVNVAAFDWVKSYEGRN